MTIRVWITPEGEVHTTTREKAHLDLADDFVRERGYPKSEHETSNDVLLKNGFVRISFGNVEGQIEALRRQSDKIAEFLQSSLLQLGAANNAAYVDFVDERGLIEVGSLVRLGEMAFYGPDDWSRLHRDALRRKMEERIAGTLFHPVSRLYRRPPVRIRGYRRRQR